MKQNAVAEIIVGLIVIAIATYFFIFAYGISNAKKVERGYILHAYFQNIDGLNQGDDVKLSGIKIGHVDNISLQNDTYFAVVKMRIQENIDVPKDSRAIVSKESLLGGNYVRIVPGASDANLAANEKIKFTQSALNLEDLIAKLMYSLTSK